MQSKDGPRPMVDKKPAKKIPNSADRFEERQAEYESRGEQPDLLGAVQRHNARPELWDELHKRRSTAQCRVDDPLNGNYAGSKAPSRHSVAKSSKSYCSQPDDRSCHTNSNDTLHRTPSSIPSWTTSHETMNSFGSIGGEPMVRRW